MVQPTNETLEIVKETIDILPQYLSGYSSIRVDKDKVWLDVYNSLPVEQAMEKLNKFDDEWFSDKFVESNGKVNINLMFSTM